MFFRPMTRYVWLIIFFVCMTACATITPASPTSTDSPTETSSPTSTPIPPTATFTSTSTETATPSPTSTATYTLTPTETQTVTPSPSTTPTPTETPTLAPAWADPNVLRIYVTHLGTGGPLACGDTLVGISSGYLRTGDPKEDIKLALNTLFASGQKVGAYHNATYPSSFRVSDVKFKVSSGKAEITLSGKYVKPEDSCEAKRYREQVWATARQHPDVHRVSIWLSDGTLLGDRLYAVSSKP